MYVKIFYLHAICSSLFLLRMVHLQHVEIFNKKIAMHTISSNGYLYTHHWLDNFIIKHKIIKMLQSTFNWELIDAIASMLLRYHFSRTYTYALHLWVWCVFFPHDSLRVYTLGNSWRPKRVIHKKRWINIVTNIHSYRVQYALCVCVLRVSLFVLSFKSDWNPIYDISILNFFLILMIEKYSIFFFYFFGNPIFPCDLLVVSTHYKFFADSCNLLKSPPKIDLVFFVTYTRWNSNILLFNWNESF